MTDIVEAEIEEAGTDTEIKTPPWEQLRKAREKKNLQQSDIAKELRLDLRFVKALEAGRLDELPQPVYTAGYIRAYAKLVGLSPDKIVGEYASQESTKMPDIIKVGEKVPARYRHVQDTLPKSFSVSHEHMDEKKKVRLLVIALAVVVAFAIAWQIMTKMTETPPVPLTTEVITESGDKAVSGVTQTPPASESVETTTLPLAIPGQSTEQQPAQSAPQPDQRGAAEDLKKNAEQMASIMLRYSEDSWVDIRDATGKPLLRRLGTAGGSNKVTGVPPFDVLLGYSPGVSIEYNGEPFDMTRYQNNDVARFTLDKAVKTPSKPKSKTGKGDDDKAEYYVSPD